MLDEPEQRLPRTAELGHLVEDEINRFLETAVGIFIDSISDFHKADRSSDTVSAAAGVLLVLAGVAGPLTAAIAILVGILILRVLACKCRLRSRGGRSRS